MKVPLIIGVCLFISPAVRAQTAKPIALPDFTYSYQKPDDYRWVKISEVKGRILFANTIVQDDSLVYSFGGFDTLLLQREMNLVDGGRLRKDPDIQYPGKGFMLNICFLTDSFLYIGGGCDSNMSRYAERDFWRYNRRNKTWKQLRDLPFYYRSMVNTFFHNGQHISLIARLGGADFFTATYCFYSYNEANDRWSILGNEMEYKKGPWSPQSFKLGDEVFMLLQYVGSLPDQASNSFYKFSLTSHKWTTRASLPGAPRCFAFAFSDGRYGYVGGGATAKAYYTRNVFRYDPRKDYWEKIRQFPRHIRRAIGWTHKGERYVGFGINDEPGTMAIWKLQGKEKTKD